MAQPTLIEWKNKLREAQTLASKAIAYESDKNYPLALHHYLQSGQIYIYLLTHVDVVSLPPNSIRSEGDPKKKELKDAARKVLERAEKIKIFAKASIPVGLKTSFLSEEEQSRILQASSKIYGKTYHIASSQTPIIPPSIKARPPSPPSLSARQIQSSAVFKPPELVLEDVLMFRTDVGSEDLEQDVVGDCSLVSGLASCLNRGPKMVFAPIFPKCEDGFPTISTDGVYALRLFINGSYRDVYITHDLPVSQDDGRPLFLSTSGRDQLWPALIEKGYLKVMGGYGWAGSNSSIDIYALTGWIPEHISISSGTNFLPQHTFSTLIKSMKSGRCVINLGTKPHSTFFGLDSMFSNLTPNHSYAVLGIEEKEDGARGVQILNPWTSNGVSRTLNVGWDAVYEHFESIYVNWDPSLFPKSQIIHFAITPPKYHRPFAQCMLTLDLKNEEGDSGEVWILVSKHFGQDPCDVAVIVTKSGNGVAVAQTELTDSPHILLKIPSAQVLVTGKFDVTVRRRGSTEMETRFSLTVYSHTHCTISDGPTPLPHVHKLEGIWSGRSMGGNHTFSTYMNNPQYLISFSSPSFTSDAGDVTLDISLESESKVPFNFHLLRCLDERVTSVEERDLVQGSSEKYKYKSVSSRYKSLSSQESYFLVPSTFHPLHEAEFILYIESSHPIHIKEVPHEGAGMFSKSFDSYWTKVKRPQFKLYLKDSMVLLIRLSPESKEGIFPPSRLRLLASDSNSSTPICTSGPFTDVVCGPSFKQRLGPGAYILVPETWRETWEGKFKIFVYSERAISLEEII